MNVRQIENDVIYYRFKIVQIDKQDNESNEISMQ